MTKVVRSVRIVRIVRSVRACIATLVVRSFRLRVPLRRTAVALAEAVSRACVAALTIAMVGCAPGSSSAPERGRGDAHAVDSNVVPNEQGPASELLINKVWRITSPSRAPGSFYVFLSNGTLIMTSCVETYRLATWRAETPARLEITEDAAVSYTADVLMLDETSASLRLNLKNEQLDVEIATAQVPFVCPDLPR